MKDIPIDDMDIKRLRIEYRSLLCLVGIKDAELEAYATTETRQIKRITELLAESIERVPQELATAALIVSLKADLNASHAAEAAAKLEAIELRRELLSPN